MTKLTDIHCEEPWFSLLRSGEKTVEGRKNSPKYSSLAEGEQIRFYCGDESFNCKITKINYYETLEAYLNENLNSALPGIFSIREGKEIYCQWNTEDEINQVGFLGINVEVTNKNN